MSLIHGIPRFCRVERDFEDPMSKAKRGNKGWRDFAGQNVPKEP